jgi:hypothetical protein
MKRSRSFFSLPLVFALIVCALGLVAPRMAFAQLSNQELLFGGTALYNSGDHVDGTTGTATLTYDTSGNPVLTLSDFNYKGPSGSYLIMYTNAAPLTIQLEGANVMTTTNGIGITTSSTTGAVTITGSGSLDITAGTDAISMKSALSIDGITVTANTTAQSGCGIYVKDGDVAIKNATVTATGGIGIHAHGGNLSIINSTVTATGTAASGSYGLRAGLGQTLTIQNSTITARGNTEAIYGNVANDIVGVGWTDATDDATRARIDIQSTAAQLPSDPTAYTKVQFPAHTISVADNIANGTVTPSFAAGVSGETVALAATPADGYELDTLTVTDASSEPVTVAADNSFTMPNSNVTITATFKVKTYTVTVVPATGGTLKPSATSAAAGTTITLEESVAQGYLSAGISVKDGAGATVDVNVNDDGDWTFVMPASNVIVTGSWVADSSADDSGNTPAPTPDSSTEDTAGSVYRVYNPNSGEHFFTQSAAERDHLVGLGWTPEGKAWNSVDGGTPVYRLYNPYAGEHHYTIGIPERYLLIGAGWTDEGVAFYAADAATGTPVYRVYNPNKLANNHHFTTNKAEYEYLIFLGWRDEGIAFYAG